MHKSILAIMFILVSASMATAENVRFATFNTFWLYDDKPPLAKWQKSQRKEKLGQDYPQSIAIIANAIKALNADVVSLQEIEGEHVLSDLAVKLKDIGVDYPYFWSGDTSDPVTGQNVGILSKFPSITKPIRRFPWLTSEYTSDRGFPAIAALGKLLRVDLEIKERSITVFAVHLKSQRGGNTADAERLAQAKLLRWVVRPRIEKGNKNSPSFAVIMGDFNDYPKSATIGVIKGNSDGSWKMNEAAALSPDTERWTYIYKGKKQQLDHIISNKFFHDRIKKVEFVRFEDSVSDHDALVAEVDLD